MIKQVNAVLQLIQSLEAASSWIFCSGEDKRWQRLKWEVDAGLYTEVGGRFPRLNSSEGDARGDKRREKGVKPSRVAVESIQTEGAYSLLWL